VPTGPAWVVMMVVLARPGVKGMATQTWLEVPGLRDYLVDRNFAPEVCNEPNIGCPSPLSQFPLCARSGHCLGEGLPVACSSVVC